MLGKTGILFRFNKEVGEFLLLACKLWEVAGTEGRGLSGGHKWAAQLPPHRTVVWPLHLWHDICPHKLLRGQPVVRKYVVNACAVVGLSRSSERGPAGESIGSSWVEIAKGVHELPTVAGMCWYYLRKFSWFTIVLFLFFSDTMKEQIQPFPSRIFIKILLRIYINKVESFGVCSATGKERAHLPGIFTILP